MTSGCSLKCVREALRCLSVLGPKPCLLECATLLLRAPIVPCECAGAVRRTAFEERMRHSTSHSTCACAAPSCPHSCLCQGPVCMYCRHCGGRVGEACKWAVLGAHARRTSSSGCPSLLLRSGCQEDALLASYVIYRQHVQAGSTGTGWGAHCACLLDDDVGLHLA